MNAAELCSLAIDTHNRRNSIPHRKAVHARTEWRDGAVAYISLYSEDRYHLVTYAVQGDKLEWIPVMGKGRQNIAALRLVGAA